MVLLHKKAFSFLAVLILLSLTSLLGSKLLENGVFFNKLINANINNKNQQDHIKSVLNKAYLQLQKNEISSFDRTKKYLFSENNTEIFYQIIKDDYPCSDEIYTSFLIANCMDIEITAVFKNPKHTQVKTIAYGLFTKKNYVF